MACARVCPHIKKIPLEIYVMYTYFSNKDIYCIFKTCCMISILFSIKCAVFHNFIFFCSNNMFFLKPCVKVEIPTWSFKGWGICMLCCWAFVSFMEIAQEGHTSYTYANEITFTRVSTPFSASSKNIALHSLSLPYWNSHSILIVGQNIFWMICVVKGY